MNQATTTCPCGQRITNLPGSGRRRKFCLTCRPRDVRPGGRRPKVDARCRHCDASFSARGGVKYCSARCRDDSKWLAHARVPCAICGGPTGWKSGAVDTATHNACRRGAWEHGTSKGYRVMRCRCAECRLWMRVEAKAYRDRRKAAGNPVNPHSHSGPWINPKVRAAVYERDAWTCMLCSEPVQPDADPQSDWYPSLDHIVPQSLGGGHDAQNLRTAHRWCNSIRGAKDYHADLFMEVS